MASTHNFEQCALDNSLVATVLFFSKLRQLFLMGNFCRKRRALYRLSTQKRQNFN